DKSKRDSGCPHPVEIRLHGLERPVGVSHPIVAGGLPVKTYRQKVQATGKTTESLLCQQHSIGGDSCGKTNRLSSPKQVGQGLIDERFTARDRKNLVTFVRCVFD